MAVASTSASGNKVSAKKESKETKKRVDIEVDINDENENKAKRANCHGVRVVGNRIYDSANGKSCHQCRQKTMDFSASCKNLKVNKLCTINFCHKCLLNRYGEKAEEVEMLGNWKCPKCRGICNCSLCMKKRGYKPTGQLVQTARKTGFSSVSEMLNVKTPNDLGHEEVVDNMCVSPEKPVASNKGHEVVSPRKRGKENSFDGKTDTNMNSEIPTPNSNNKKSKKTKREGLKEICIGGRGDGAHPKMTSPKKPKLSKDIYKKEVKSNENDSEKKEEKDIGTHKDVPNAVKNHNAKDKPKKVPMSRKVKMCTLNLENKEIEADIPLPQGDSLTTVADIELPPEDVGHALQFLEFCASFGKALEVKKGQAESLLQELRYGRRGRRAQYSMTVQFHIQLLSLLRKDAGKKPLLSSPTSPTNGRNSWLQALEECISESQCVLKDLPSDCFDRGADGYDNLDFAIKLKILNFLCDEALGTVKLRSWIDVQNSKFFEQEKEAKEKVVAAKDKEKRLKKMLQDEVAKAIIAKSGAPLSISEHEAIVSQIKSDTAHAHAEMLDAMGMVSKKRQRSDAVRTEAIFLDNDGRAFWKLTGYTGEEDILLQDMGTWDAVVSEKWFSYGVEQKQAIEKYISSLRAKRLQVHNVAHAIPSGSNEANV